MWMNNYLLEKIPHPDLRGGDTFTTFSGGVMGVLLVEPQQSRLSNRLVVDS
jgi:hypothetical protein